MFSLVNCAGIFVMYEEYPSEKYPNLKPTETEAFVNSAKMTQIPDTMTAVVFDGPHNVSIQKRPTPKSEEHPLAFWETFPTKGLHD